MRIAVLGTGHIGGTLGKKWLAAGHEVVFGVRDPAGPKAQAFLSSLTGARRAASLANAAEAGEVVVFAIPGGAMDEAARAYGPAVNGKIVIDTTNNVGQPVMNHVAAIVSHAPASQVYRAFNTIGWDNFANPVIGGVQADLFYCGPGGGRATVEQLIGEVGLRPVWVGGSEQADLVDGLLKLWFQLVAGQGMGRHLAFKLLRD